MKNEPSIPFEPQINRPGYRCCGAAALTMVLRSFGLDADQETVQKKIAGYDPNSRCSRSFHLSRCALEYGLAAIPCRLQDPWSILTNPGDIRLILNHRVRPESPLGHYTVFLSANESDETVYVHDPQFGPNRQLTKLELLELWTPKGDDCEITGSIAVLVVRQS